MTFTIALSVNLCRSKKICSTDIREENANLSKERAALQSEVERQRILMKELSELSQQVVFTVLMLHPV